MNIRFYSLLLFLLLLGLQASANTRGRVIDSVTREGLPFATVRVSGTSAGTVTDLSGHFILPEQGKNTWLEISYLGYNPKKVRTGAGGDSLIIALSPSEASLKEVVFTPPYDKIRRIINNTISHRNKNNPEQYDWYRCHVYYKMVVDVRFPKETDSSKEVIDDFLNKQHLLMSETYSIRSWKKPQRLQEEIVASRFSGFKKSPFTNIVTNALPFHAYSDYLTLNGKDYHNPISKGYNSRYDFNLTDELVQGSDTLWLLSFRPRNKSADDLKGTVYINSNGFAIAYLLAAARDEKQNKSVKLEQQYQYINGRWFPSQLNYLIDLNLVTSNKGAKDTINYKFVGNSQIDSVSWKEEEGFRFDKMHTVKLQRGADEKKDEDWTGIRPVSLDEKERRTYQFTDSIMDKSGINKFVPYLDKIIEGKFPVSVVDIDLKRIYSQNRYEGTRVGLGLQTNEKVLQWLSIGGWAGYGFKDKEWKYGAFAEVYADKYKDFVIRVAYDNDLRDPGRVQINKDLDKNYLRMYLLQRVDRITTYSVSVKKRLGYWQVELVAKQETIVPMYSYILLSEGKALTEFTTQEASLNLRYAFAERRAPMFGKYYNTGTKYSILYGKVTTGRLESAATINMYTQVIGAVAWQKHLNRIGNERFLLMGGKSWSDKPLPISKLFAGKGFSYDDASFYAFGGMLTMRPYDYYMDQYVNVYWRHDFDWRLFKANFSAPSVSIQHNFLWGTLEHKEVHIGPIINAPDEGYHETGIILNSLLRYNFLNLYYLSIKAGYFVHWTADTDLKRDGRFVYGIDLEL